MRSSSPSCGAIIDVTLNISYSQVRKTFSFDRSHKFEEIFFAIDCILIDHVRLLSIRTLSLLIFFKISLL